MATRMQRQVQQRFSRNRRGVQGVFQTLTVTDGTDADLAAFIAVDGELGVQFGRASKVNDWFEIVGTGDTADNALAAAKGSALAAGDRFKITNVATPAVKSMSRFGAPSAPPPSEFAQDLTFDAANCFPLADITNGGRTIAQGTPVGSWHWMAPGDNFALTRASGGKYMYEIVIDYMTASSFVSLGWGEGNKSGWSTIYCGNADGGGLLIDDENGSLSRMYKGFADNSFVNSTTPRYPQDAGGSIFTFGIDLDAETVSAYMDGLAIIENQAYATNTPTATILPVLKPFSGSIITFQTEIAHPIDGYAVWPNSA